MFTAASDTMIPQLRTLWKRVFGDADAYLDLFFRECFPTSEALVAQEDGRICSVLYLLPLTLIAAGRPFSAKYIYAVATDPADRRRGLSTALLEEAHRRLFAEGVSATVLVPAERSLFSYYGARGFETAFTVERRAEIVCEGETLPVREAELAALQPLRDRFFASCALYGAWDEQSLAYREHEAELLGGKVICFTYKNHECYAVCVPDGETVRVAELAAPPDEIVLRTLAFAFDKRRVLLRLPAQNGEPFAMLHRCGDFPPVGKGPRALSLVLD